MKKFILILVTIFLFVFNLAIPTTVLAQDPGPPKAKEWKGPGEKIEFQSIPVITMKDFLNRKIPEETKTISGTLNFPANAPDKNVPVVVIMHGGGVSAGGGIAVWEEHWMETFNSIGFATFMVDSNWGRRKCKKTFKKAIPNCNDVHKGITRIVDGYRALELLSKHPRIDPDKIGCIGMSLGGRGCLYLNVKRFQKMWGTPGLEYAASVPLYPPCNVKFKEDDEITDTPIRIHVGELDTFFPVDSCVDYVERLRAKRKDVEVKVYANAHHGFDAKMVFHGGKTTVTSKDYGFGKCYLEENTDSSILNEENLGEGFYQIITQVGFKEWFASAEEKKKKKLFKWIKKGNKRGFANPFILFDKKSCVTKTSTMGYNKEAAEEAEQLIKDFLITTFKL
jgi:dienelactone hydrolase